MKRQEIKLKDAERRELELLSSSGVCSVRTLQRAQVLLALDRGVLDTQITEVLGIERTRIWRIRKRYIADGLNRALVDQARPGRPREYDEKAEADLVALACSAPPSGYSRWSLPLLTEVARQQSRALSSVSPGKVKQVLKKKRCKPWLKRMWCIGKLTPVYRARMYDVIDLYHRPYNPEEPVVCVDEKSKQLLSDTRVPIACKPGAPSKQDYEYERRGTRNLFVAVEPLAGWRQVTVTKHRKKPDFVRFIRQLLQGRYRQAKKVHLVLDNLNTHFAKGFLEVLGQKRADKLLSRIEFHYTPVHASWLNLAEIEIGILDKQCLDRRIPTAEKMIAEVEAWKTKRNRQRKTIDWSFTKEKADEKLGKYYIDVA